MSPDGVCFDNELRNFDFSEFRLCRTKEQSIHGKRYSLFEFEASGKKITIRLDRIAAQVSVMWNRLSDQDAPDQSFEELSPLESGNLQRAVELNLVIASRVLSRDEHQIIDAFCENGCKHPFCRTKYDANIAFQDVDFYKLGHWTATYELRGEILVPFGVEPRLIDLVLTKISPEGLEEVRHLPFVPCARGTLKAESFSFSTNSSFVTTSSDLWYLEAILFTDSGAYRVIQELSIKFKTEEITGFQNSKSKSNFQHESMTALPLKTPIDLAAVVKSRVEVNQDLC